MKGVKGCSGRPFYQSRFAGISEDECRKKCDLASRLFVKETYYLKGTDKYGTMCCTYINYYSPNITFPYAVNVQGCELYGNSEKILLETLNTYNQTTVLGTSYGMIFLN